MDCSSLDELAFWHGRALVGLTQPVLGPLRFVAPVRPNGPRSPWAMSLAFRRLARGCAQGPNSEALRADSPRYASVGPGFQETALAHALAATMMMSHAGSLTSA
jgi:hypothetical protein